MNPFDTFLLGTHRKGNSPIKYLPEEILIMIANKLADSTSITDSIKNNWGYGFERQLSRCRDPGGAVRRASLEGRLDLIIRSNKWYPINPYVIENAAACGHIHIIERVNSEFGIPNHQRALYLAMMTGRIETAEWLLNHGTVIEDSLCCAVVGNMTMVNWASERGIVFSEDSLIWALRHTNPDMEVLEWFYTHYPQYFSTPQVRSRIADKMCTREWYETRFGPLIQ